MKAHSKNVFACFLTAFDISPPQGAPSGAPKARGLRATCGDRTMEFHVQASLRSLLRLKSPLFKTTGNLIVPDIGAARDFADRLRKLGRVEGQDTSGLSAGRLNAMGLIDEILHIVVGLYRERVFPEIMPRLMADVRAEIGQGALDSLLVEFTRRFPPAEVYRDDIRAEAWLESASSAEKTARAVPNRELAFEELVLLKLANENPAFAPYRFLFDDGLRATGARPDSLGGKTRYKEAFEAIERASRSLPRFGPAGQAYDLISLLKMPAQAAPGSLEAQLEWIRDHWGAAFDEIGLRILRSLDLIKEEETPRFPPGRGPVAAYDYSSSRNEYENFTQDKDWMPSLVLLAKNVLVWLYQLSSAYGRPIRRLDEIPDQELDLIASRGINGLWLIGIWQRSPASEKIKRLCGNPEAVASAYALFDYEIAFELGGWAALDTLRERCLWRGIRLAADMVPNHTGIDSDWVRNRPGLFIGSEHCPFPGYSFNGPDLSEDPGIGIWLEDHYYTKNDAAVVFKRLDRRSGQARYIYHGNDGTGMAWNDTAQIDFLNPEARAAVKERILYVARHFSIIRFDAAMVLARQHIRRLWYPAPGSGGAIPSRAEHSMSDAAFDRALPHEFWREVVDECADKAPDTLLLAEAFWMMEGYFTRTLGMHRVYNSAFMNMLKDEKNSLYRLTIKNTQEFDKQILKRFVNFMNNPDEEPAIAQFGSGDKYFGICAMMATMPGLPMFGHGQIEGFTEKYGMEYMRAYRDEKPDSALIARHEREIFPLLRRRKLFAEVEHFHLFDFMTDDKGHVDENVFAYSNGRGEERALVFYNNFWKRSSGKISTGCSYGEKDKDGKKFLKTVFLSQALALDTGSGNFLVARELRSGLWHVYRCADLAEKGWSVGLEGYQSLVFCDFIRVRDMDGRYAALEKKLRGAGVAALDEALEEAARPELYHALGKALDALRNCAAALARKTGVVEAARRAGDEAETYFSRLAQAAAEEEGSEPRIVAAAESRSVLEAGIAILSSALAPSPSKKGRTVSRGAAFENFRGLLDSERSVRIFLRYVFIAALARVHPKSGTGEELRYILAKFLVKTKLLQEAEKTEASEPAAAPAEARAAGVSAAAATIAARNLVDEKTLCSFAFAFATRPKDDAAEETPLPAGKSASSAGAAKNRRVKSSQAAVRAKTRAIELLRWASADREAAEALGFNVWNGEQYFNKEKFEALLEFWPWLAFLEAALGDRGETESGGGNAHDAAAAAALAKALEVADILRRAEKESAFKTAALLAAIENA